MLKDHMSWRQSDIWFADRSRRVKRDLLVSPGSSIVCTRPSAEHRSRTHAGSQGYWAEEPPASGFDLFRSWAITGNGNAMVVNTVAEREVNSM